MASPAPSPAPEQLLLYACPALDARLTPCGCAANRQRVEYAAKLTAQEKRLRAKPQHRPEPWLASTCPGCPGVVALAESGQTPPPQAYDTSGHAPPQRRRRRRKALRFAPVRPGDR